MNLYFKFCTHRFVAFWHTSLPWIHVINHHISFWWIIIQSLAIKLRGFKEIIIEWPQKHQNSPIFIWFLFIHLFIKWNIHWIYLHQSVNGFKINKLKQEKRKCIFHQNNKWHECMKCHSVLNIFHVISAQCAIILVIYLNVEGVLWLFFV